MDAEKFLDKLEMTVSYSGRDKTDSWEYDSWDVSLTWDKRALTIPYRMGLAHDGREPSMLDVLQATRADCSMLATLGEQTFEQWCLEYGFNPDSVTELRLFESVVREDEDMRILFGEEFDLFMELFEEKW